MNKCTALNCGHCSCEQCPLGVAAEAAVAGEAICSRQAAIANEVRKDLAESK